MPKETIQYGETETSVRWGKGSYVQLHVHREPYEVCDDDGKGCSFTGVDTYSEPLTRDEVNALIRALRRARDQVYGRDE